MKRNGLYAVLAASLLVLPAHAAEPGAQIYVGLGMGMVNLPVEKGSMPSLTAASSVNANSYNFNGFVGYQFDSYLGMELGYLGSGSVTATTQGQTSKLFDVVLTSISATLGTSVNDKLWVYTKFGGTEWRFSSPENADLSRGFGPNIGLGADINLYGNSERKLRIEYNYYLLDKVYVKSASSLTINAVFFFPETTKRGMERTAFKAGE